MTAVNSVLLFFLIFDSSDSDTHTDVPFNKIKILYGYTYSFYQLISFNYLYLSID